MACGSWHIETAHTETGRYTTETSIVSGHTPSYLQLLWTQLSPHPSPNFAIQHFSIPLYNTTFRWVMSQHQHRLLSPGTCLLPFSRGYHFLLPQTPRRTSPQIPRRTSHLPHISWPDLSSPPPLLTRRKMDPAITIKSGSTDNVEPV